MTDVERRIDEIVDLMERLEWRHHRHVPELSAQWGVARSTVESYATTASRIIRALVRRSPDDMRDEIVGALRRNAQDARSGGDIGNSTRALGEMAELVGIKRHRLAIEVESDLDRRLETLAKVLDPSVYRTVAQVLCGQELDDGGETVG
jgi:hypothetical protein